MTIIYGIDVQIKRNIASTVGLNLFMFIPILLEIYNHLEIQWYVFLPIILCNIIIGLWWWAVLSSLQDRKKIYQYLRDGTESPFKTLPKGYQQKTNTQESQST